MPDRFRVVVRRQRLYVDADDLAGMLRARAARYRDRADAITRDLSTPTLAVVGDLPPEVGQIVPPLEEALACRMVAEELEQRADQLDRL